MLVGGPGWMEATHEAWISQGREITHSPKSRSDASCIGTLATGGHQSTIVNDYQRCQPGVLMLGEGNITELWSAGGLIMVHQIQRNGQTRSYRRRVRVSPQIAFLRLRIFGWIPPGVKFC